MHSKKASWDGYLSSVDLQQAVSTYKALQEKNKANKEHPVMSTIKLSPIGDQFGLWGARRKAYISSLEGSENFKAMIPFLGMGQRGQRIIDKEMAKSAAFTDHGAKRERIDAHMYLRNAEIYRDQAEKHPDKAMFWGHSRLPMNLDIAARTLAAKSELKGADKVLNFVPFYGVGSKGTNILQNDRKKEGKNPRKVENIKDSAKGELIGTGITLGGAGLAMGGAYKLTKDLKNNPGGEKEEALSKKLVGYFNDRGTKAPILEISDPERSFFNPIKGNIASSAKTPEILAHELGHADNARQFQKVLGIKAGLGAQIGSLPISNLIKADIGEIGKLSPIGLLAAAPLMSDKLTDKFKSDDEDSTRNKIIDIIQKYPEIPVGIATAPLLIEEGRASAKALKAIKTVGTKADVSRARGRLAPAYATYAGMSMLPLGAAAIWGHRKRKQREKDEQKRKKD